MASKVNTKFVVLLGTAVVVGLGLLLGAAYLLVYRSAEDLVQLGDRAMARGEYVEAAAHYAKACDKEKTNPANFVKWRASIEKQVPETPVQFEDAMRGWRGATRQLAMLQKDNLAAQREYLETMRGVVTGPFDRGNLQYLKSETDLILSGYAGKPAGPWENLRRYRGLAQLRIAAEDQNSRQPDWDVAIEDLNAALKADPKDYESAMGLEGIYYELSDRATRGGKTEEAKRLNDMGREVIRAFVEANPSEPMMMLGTLRRDMGDAAREFQQRVKEAQDRGLPTPDPVAESKVFTEAGLERLNAAFEAAKGLGGQNVTSAMVNGFKQTELSIDRQARLSRTAELVRMGLEARPDDLDLIAARAEISAELNDFAAGVDHLEQILDAEPRPVGPEGAKLFTYRNNARFLRALWSVRAYLAVDPAMTEERKAALTRAQAYRDELLKNEDAASTRVELVQAWHAFVNAEYSAADRLLTSLDRRSRITDPDTVVMWANVAVAQNQPGAAKDRLRTVMQVQPDNLAAAVAYGQITLSLQDYSTARQVFENILKIAPAFDQAQRGLEAANAGLGLGKVADPVQQVLLEAMKAQKDGVGEEGTDATINTMLTEAVLEHGPEPRLVQALVMARLNIGDREGALGVVREAKGKHPDSRVLKDLETVLTTEDPNEANLKIIESRADVPLVNRLLAKHELLKRMGRSEEASKVLEELVAAEPESEQVIELQFIAAAQQKDWVKAEEMAERAGKLNLDKVEGRTFRARLLAARGETRAAAEQMQAVVDANVRSPEVYRLLGRLQLSLGRPTEAVNAYREALKLRPNDAAAIKDLVTALVSQGQRDQALVTAREGEKFAGNDPEFLDLWLKIESEFGNLPMVVERRERMALANPRDRENLYELGRLYVMTGEMDKARPVIDRVKALGDDVDALGLDASWHWTRNDRASAKRVFDEFTSRSPDAGKKLLAHLAFAQFLAQHGDRAGSVATLEAARAFQDPKTLDADRALAETLFSQGDLERAVVVLQSLVDSGSDSADGAFRKRLVEAQIRMKRLEDAERTLSPLVSGKDTDMVAMLLEADLRDAQGRKPEQRQILDRVISKYPGEAAPFVKRAQSLMAQEESRREAINDLTMAIQKNPNMWQAFRLRASLYGQMKDPDKALTDLREAVRLNPTDDDMLVSLVMDLLRMQRDQQAEDAAREALKGRGREGRSFARVGELFLRLGRPEIAAKFLEDAFNLDPNDGVALGLLTALMAGENPQTAKADEVIRRLGDRVPKNPGMMMSLAKVRIAQNRVQEGIRAAADALRVLAPDRPDQMLAWHRDMDQIVKDGPRYLKFIDDTLRAGIVPGLNDWLAFFRAEILTRNQASMGAAISELTSLLTKSTNKAIRIFALRLRGTASFTLGLKEDALAQWQEGVAEFPEDAEMNNNLAYLLTAAGKYQEALPLAEIALKGNANNPDVLDTIGLIYMKLGRYQEAQQSLEASLVYATTPRQNLTAGMHLAETLFLRGKTDDAVKLTGQIKELMDQVGPNADEAMRTNLAALLEKAKKPQ